MYVSWSPEFFRFGFIFNGGLGFFRYFRHTNVQAIFYGFFSWNQGLAHGLSVSANIFWTKIVKKNHCGRVEWIIRQESKRVWFFFDRYFFVKEIVASFLLICLFFVAFTVKDFPIFKSRFLIVYAILCRDLLSTIWLRRCKPSWKKKKKKN